MSIDRTEEIEDYIIELYDLRVDQQDQNIDIRIIRNPEAKYFIQGKYKPYYRFEIVPESFTCGSWTDASQGPSQGTTHFKEILVNPEREYKILQHINYKIDIVYSNHLFSKINKIIETSKKRLDLDWIVTRHTIDRNGYDKWSLIFSVSNKEDYKEISDYISNPDEYVVTSDSIGITPDGIQGRLDRRKIPDILSPPLRYESYQTGYYR